jgi:hypothetical protein
VALEERSPAHLDARRAVESWPNSRGASRLEVVPRSLMRWVSEYDLLLDSKTIGELRWIGGRYPELHLEAGHYSGFVVLMRLRPFVLDGRLEGPAPGAVEILHVGSAGQGLVEVGGVQFMRRTTPSGNQEVRDQRAAVVLTSLGSSARRILLYDHASSNLEVAGLLELALVEAFCAIYIGKHMFRSMLAAWVRLPSFGTPLTLLPKVRKLMLDSE